MINLLLLLSLILDGILSVYIDTTSYLLPLLTLTTIYIIYPLYKNKQKTYNVIIIITGVMYDLLYTNLLFFHAIVFYLISKLIKYIYKNYNQNFFKTVLYLIIIISSYELLTSGIFFLLKVVNITTSKIVYKIIHSLLLNLIYASILYLILKKRLSSTHK